MLSIEVFADEVDVSVTFKRTLEVVGWGVVIGGYATSL